ncbi:hypothetical protein [Devosia sp.]|uniref:hypothetical protein n=1 Tax=Devosia sp. TaxID=1871048 RepID=UPI003BA947AF
MRGLLFKGLMIAIMASSALPAVAAEDCGRWAAEMLEDEGGPVLTAHVCSTEAPDVELLLTCYGGEFGLRVDLATDESADLTGSPVDVNFTTEGGSQTLAMIYEEMDGRHATSLSADAPLVQLLQSGTSLSVRDAAGAFAEHQFSLEGSSKAIGALLQACH